MLCNNLDYGYTFQSAPLERIRPAIAQAAINTLRNIETASIQSCYTFYAKQGMLFRFAFMARIHIKF